MMLRSLRPKPQVSRSRPSRVMSLSFQPSQSPVAARFNASLRLIIVLTRYFAEGARKRAAEVVDPIQPVIGSGLFICPHELVDLPLDEHHRFAHRSLWQR